MQSLKSSEQLMAKQHKTLFDKIWDAHVVKHIDDGPDVLYIDKHLVHEVTSPQAFSGLREKKASVFRPRQVLATADHNVPTMDQEKEIKDERSRAQIEELKKNAEANSLDFYGLNHPKQGIVHVVGPEQGFTLPGNTIVCGDSHTSTHGAFGTIAFGIGTSEVEMVLASQCVLQSKPKQMRINLNGKLQQGATAKDLILYVISQLSAKGATGHFVEYAGEAIRNMTMEERMTVCNMSIEMGARGGLIAPDENTFEYIRSTPAARNDGNFDQRIEQWEQLYTDPEAHFDKEYDFDVSVIEPMITYGTNPGMGMAINDAIPGKESYDNDKVLKKSLDYMGLQPGEKLLGKKINYIFLGSCTNGRIGDLRSFARMVKGRKKAPYTKVYIVPGSKQVEMQAKNEGLENILNEAGFEFRQPGCSACLAMNDDKIPPGEYCVSTTNRNFEGRQGPGSRTILASPLTAAATAITGKITDPRELLKE
jgi:3-isopropylmalate/(R)-2-methylmalate dehydratase large subunit